jgi:endogenous inhibitor of DNA gyrase (YacG/DUF329 family)
MPERDESESPPESSGRGVPEWKTDSKTERETGIDGSAVDHGGVSPPEAFSMLANETRIEILQALWERRDEPVAFSELHADVDVDRGNFNYHLSKLAEHFVRQTQAGYELREAGKAVIRAVLAGTITHDPRIEPTDLGVPCPLCGGAIEFSYADEFITVRCTSCAGVMGGDVPSGTFMHHTFPPAGLQGRHGIEVLEAARVHYETDLVTMLQGVCPECGGTVDRSIHVCAEHETDGDGMCTACGSVPDIWVEHVCANCSYSRWCVIWLPILFHPAVIAFVYERQPFESFLELRRLFWVDPGYIDGIERSVVSEAPLEVEVRVPFDGDEIRVTVDEELRTKDVR